MRRVASVYSSRHLRSMCHSAYTKLMQQMSMHACPLVDLSLSLHQPPPRQSADVFIYSSTYACRLMQSRGPRSAHTPSPAVFDLGSAIAATLLVVSTSGLIYLGSTQHINRSTVEQALWHPPAIACIASFLGALLYMLVRHGVPYKSMPGDGVVPSTAAIARQNLAVDTDVIVVGAGTVGAALATVLARDGKRVLLIERCVCTTLSTHHNSRSVTSFAPGYTLTSLAPSRPCSNMSQVDRIVGELLQPGGVRALERMGLGAAAKGAGAGGVVVDG